MENQDITNAQNALLDAINNPKSNLQYQLYKLDLRLYALAESMYIFAKTVSETLSEAINSFVNFVSEYYQIIDLGKKSNPRIAYLAYHAKTQRQRKKNFNRLYQIGCDVKKQREKGDELSKK